MHTKGKWEVNAGLKHQVLLTQTKFTKHEKVYQPIEINVVGYEFQKDECEANARLISASPELLEACKLAMDFLTIKKEPAKITLLDLQDKLQSAINKAENKE